MNLLEVFCHVDDFVKVFMPAFHQQLLTHQLKKRHRMTRLSTSEIMTILIFFHYSHYRDFKAYYLQWVRIKLRQEFPHLLSYKRFVALIPSVLVPLCAYLQSIKATSDGLAFVDSTSIAVCHRKRISQHKVFAGMGQLGKSTKGWFFGLKLHLICNHRGELVACRITPGNVDDREPLPEMAKNLWGKLFGDKGYISQPLFEELFANGLQLITGIKKNMKNKLLPLFDKLMLRKRSLIECIIHQLKNVFQAEHSRHRNPINGLINIITALVAYMHYPNKPTLGLNPKEINLLQLSY